MLTAEHVKWLAPRAKPGYVGVITSEWGWQILAHYQISASVPTLAAFLANSLHETGGWTIIHESLNYKSPARLRAVWPKRYGSKSDAELAHLCGNEVALASDTYNGRMGNRPGTTDGYDFRGALWLQSTGRDHCIALAAKCGYDLAAQPQLLEDFHVNFMMACLEWYEGGCNQAVSEGDFDGACAIINVGNRRAVRACVGLDDRRKWYGKCTQLLTGNPSSMEPPAADLEEVSEDGDTVPGQVEHWLEHDEEAAAA